MPSPLKIPENKLDRPEIRRKLLHLVALVIPLGIALLPRASAVGLFAALSCTMLAGELLRKRSPLLQKIFLKVFGSVIRPEEKEEITGGTFFFVSGAICVTAFDTSIAYTVMAFIIVGDAAAALVGIKFGRIRTPAGKSLEGALASILSCLLFWFIFPGIGFAKAIAAAVLTGTLELLPFKINDNLFVPVICGLILQTWTGW